MKNRSNEVNPRSYLTYFPESSKQTSVCPSEWTKRVAFLSQGIFTHKAADWRTGNDNSDQWMKLRLMNKTNTSNTSILCHVSISSYWFLACVSCRVELTLTIQPMGSYTNVNVSRRLFLNSTVGLTNFEFRVRHVKFRIHKLVVYFFYITCHVNDLREKFDNLRFDPLLLNLPRCVKNKETKRHNSRQRRHDASVVTPPMFEPCCINFFKDMRCICTDAVKIIIFLKKIENYSNILLVSLHLISYFSKKYKRIGSKMQVASK